MVQDRNHDKGRHPRIIIKNNNHGIFVPCGFSHGSTRVVLGWGWASN